MKHIPVSNLQCIDICRRHLKKKEPETWRYSLDTVEECMRELHSLDSLLRNRHWRNVLEN